MSFPELRLAKKARERDEKENLENIHIMNDYDVSVKSIPDSKYKVNIVYDGVKVKQRSYTVNDFVIIEHNNKYYPVIRILSKKKNYPLVIDFDQLENVKGFEADGVSGNWNLTNNYVTFSKKKGTTMYYLHNILTGYEPDGSGKDSVDHLNRIKLDNRLANLCMKSQSDQNVNQKVRKCSSKQLDNMPQPYRDYYLANRPRYIYWLYEKKHGHRMIVGPLGSIREKKYSSNNSDEIPTLMKKAEKYLIDEAIKNGMTEDQITSELDPVSHQLKREYTQIVMKASRLFEIEV